MDLQALARFIASHDMPLARPTETAVEVSCEVVGPEGEVYCSMPETVTTLKQAKDWLGY